MLKVICEEYEVYKIGHHIICFYHEFGSKIMNNTCWYSLYLQHDAKYSKNMHCNSNPLGSADALGPPQPHIMTFKTLYVMHIYL